jgi:hypothetical protein
MSMEDRGRRLAAEAKPDHFLNVARCEDPLF